MPQGSDSNSYNDADHAKTYQQLKPSSDRNSAQIDADFKVLMEDGYVILENLISPSACAEIKKEGLELLGQAGRNGFEGRSTQRVYDVLSKTRATDRLADHPRVLGLMDRLFRPGFLLSQSQIINIKPGETAQALHCDDSFYRIPRPRQALGAATIWAIDAFTEDNGATVVVPSSHVWDDDRTAARTEAISAVMPAGSAIFFLGTTWHGGGENHSANDRFAITHQYCEAYMRQQENYLLELSKDTVRALSPELKSLVGYSIYPPFMGMVEGMHPLRLLEKK
ncbi:MAG: phytanoyl-CoA dioxygenase family protein [Parvibaculaceae bacterium]|nr:phytanoyl-CoA dioxygenase family protein [Parvibaculaceae bacterium]